MDSFGTGCIRVDQHRWGRIDIVELMRDSPRIQIVPEEKKKAGPLIGPSKGNIPTT
jgi:hypothetical protein